MSKGLNDVAQDQESDDSLLMKRFCNDYNENNEAIKVTRI